MKRLDFDPDTLDWRKGDGLLPAIVQHARDGRVLMLGYMSRKAIDATLRNGRVTFYSRSRKRLWTKGETSGNHLALTALHADCDRDTLLVLAKPAGPVCHCGTTTCFPYEAVPASHFLNRLDALIARRERERPPGSYTAGLFEGGLSRIAQKVGEEGVETSLAAVCEDDDALIGEAADLFYHLLVLLRARGAGLDELTHRLRFRHRNQ